MGVSRAMLRKKKPDIFTLRFCIQSRQESRKNWPDRPESYTNDIKVNPTQKSTEMFIMLIRKTCPGLYENILNSYKALRTSGRCFSLTI